MLLIKGAEVYAPEQLGKKDGDILHVVIEERQS